VDSPKETPPSATILIVDDEPIALDFLKRVLRGYDLLTAADGAQALRILKSNEVDVLITDYRMPGITGLTVLAACRAGSPRTRRLLMTAYSDLPEIAHARAEALFEQLITKPGNPAIIRRIVEDVLRGADPSAER
jgi:CheY-like chemotaxis protein